MESVRAPFRHYERHDVPLYAKKPEETTILRFPPAFSMSGHRDIFYSSSGDDFFSALFLPEYTALSMIAIISCSSTLYNFNALSRLLSGFFGGSGAFTGSGAFCGSAAFVASSPRTKYSHYLKKIVARLLSTCCVFYLFPFSI